MAKKRTVTQATQEPVSLGDFARMYSISPANLANLRARDPDFPKPAEVKGRTYLYSLDDVQQFAKRRGWVEVEVPLDVDPTATDLPDLPAAVTAALAAGAAVELTGDRDVSEVVKGVLDSQHPWAASISASGIGPVLQSAAGTSELTIEWKEQSRQSAQQRAERLSDRVDEMSRDAAGRMLPTATSSALTEWVMGAAGAVPSVVADPACGFGAFLAAAALSGEPKPQLLVGADRDPAAIRVSALRLLGMRVHSELVVCDALDPSGPISGYANECGLVLLDAPYGPNREWAKVATSFGQPPVNEQAFLWVALAHRLLADGGRAVIVAPRRTLEAGGRADRFRRALAAAGAVLATVTLPKGMRPGSAPDLALWVLAKAAEEQPQPVLSVNGAYLMEAFGRQTAPGVLRGIIGQFARDREKGSIRDWDDIKLPEQMDTSAVRLIRPAEEHGGAFELTPWAADSDQVLPNRRAIAQRRVSEHRSGLARKREELLRTIGEVRSDLSDLGQTLRAIQRPESGQGVVRLTGLVGGGQVVVYESGQRTDGTTREMRLSPWSRKATGDSGDIEHRTQPEPGDVLVHVAVEEDGRREIKAEVIAGEGSPSEYEGGGRAISYLLRIRNPSDWLTPQVLADAMAAMDSDLPTTATVWQLSSRNIFDLRQAARFIRIPIDKTDQLAMYQAREARKSLDSLSRELADPLLWS